MKLKKDVEVTDLQGQPINQDYIFVCSRCGLQDKIIGKRWTIGTVCIEALDAIKQGQNLSGEDKYKRHLLMDKIMNEKDLDSNDIKILMPCLEEFCGVKLYGFIKDYIDVKMKGGSGDKSSKRKKRK